MKNVALPLSTSIRLIAALTPLVLGACANQAVTRTGFLENYETLSSTDGNRSLTYRNAGRDALKRRFVIDEIEIRLPADQAGLPVAIQESARADYRAALEKVFAPEASSASNQGGGDALHVRAAITGLKPSNPKLNLLTLLVIGPVSNGGVSTESEIVDARTGRRIAAQATYTNGHLFNAGIGGYFDELGHVRKAFDIHATKLHELALPAPLSSATRVGHDVMAQAAAGVVR